MSSTTFYYHPDEGGTLETLEVGQLASDWEELPYSVRSDAIAGSGRTSRYHLRSGLRIRILHERFPEGKVDEMRALLRHLGRGKRMGVTADNTKLWCSYVTSPVNRGDSTVTTGSNVWYGYGSSGITSGDDIVVETYGPVPVSEHHSCNLTIGSSASVVTLATSALTTLPTDQVSWVRHLLFYPVCYLPADVNMDAILTSQQRRLWTLDLTLEVDFHALAELYATEIPIIQTSTSDVERVQSIDSALQKRLEIARNGFASFKTSRRQF